MKRKCFSVVFSVLIYFIFSYHPGFAQQPDGSLFFSFGDRIDEGIPVNGQTIWPYTQNGIKYGITGNVETNKKCITAKEPFVFWAELPEGNYRVEVTLGGDKASKNTTIKSESRRLMAYNLQVPARAGRTVEFLVNVRSAKINKEDSIRLKSREFKYLNWDGNLSIEFGGDNPSVQSVMITPDSDVPTIFLAGNSTVVDQENEPWASWGQMFPVFLKPEIVVANFAESGETLKSFVSEKRFDKVASLIKPGDFIFMEFAHNDQKPGGGHVEPYSTYDEYLMKFVKLARENDATPVFVTSTNRRAFDDEDEIINTLEDYPDAMRKLARKEGVLLIDLNSMSKSLYEALGVEGSKKAFVHYDAGTFPGQEKPLADNTHFSTYGAWQLAKCIIEGIRTSDSELKNYLKDDCEPYDPKQPDPFSSWKWPMSRNGSLQKPDGN